MLFVLNPNFGLQKRRAHFWYITLNFNNIVNEIRSSRKNAGTIVDNIGLDYGLIRSREQTVILSNIDFCLEQLWVNRPGQPPLKTDTAQMGPQVYIFESIA